MTIRQTRINSCSYFAAVPLDEPVYIRVDDVGRFKGKLAAFGFKASDESGTTILPCSINCYAKKNAEPFFTVDKNLPKETYTQTVYWTRHEWAGRDQYNLVTDFSFISRERYHRDYFAPYSVRFTLVTDVEKPYIISDAIIHSEENRGMLLNTVNMVLNVFGECRVDHAQKETDVHREVVNWDILPKGEYPWEAVKETLSEVSKGRTKTQAQMMLRNCELIYEKHPDFVAYGRSGFRGYAVFGFISKNLFILESALPNNATYVLQDDWETLSRLSKAEILSNGFHKDRIVHSSNWQKRFDELMEEENG